MQEKNGCLFFYAPLFTRLTRAVGALLMLVGAYILFLMRDATCLYSFMAFVLGVTACILLVFSFRPEVSVSQNALKSAFFQTVCWADVERAVYTPAHLSGYFMPLVTLFIAPGSSSSRFFGVWRRKAYAVPSRWLTMADANRLSEEISKYVPVENYPLIPSGKKPGAK